MFAPCLIQFRPQENAALGYYRARPCFALPVAPLDRLLVRRGSGAARWQGLSCLPPRVGT